MAEFIRFMRGGSLVEAIAHAQADLERGYSFAAYARFDSEDEALDSDQVQYLGVDAETIAPMPEGGYGFALDGLCGYEDDGRDLCDYPYSETFAFVARFEGRRVGEADQGDGDLFRPSRLISVDAVADVASVAA